MSNLNVPFRDFMAVYNAYRSLPPAQREPGRLRFTLSHALVGSRPDLALWVVNMSDRELNAMRILCDKRRAASDRPDKDTRTGGSRG